MLTDNMLICGISSLGEYNPVCPLIPGSNEISFRVDFSGSFEATSIETKLLFDVLKLDNPLMLNISIVEPLDNFTYGATAQKLWLAKDLDNKTLPR